MDGLNARDEPTFMKSKCLAGRCSGQPLSELIHIILSLEASLPILDLQTTHDWLHEVGSFRRSSSFRQQSPCPSLYRTSYRPQEGSSKDTCISGPRETQNYRRFGEDSCAP